LSIKVRKMLLLLVLVVAIVSLTACGEGEQGTSTGTPETTSASSGNSTAPGNEKELFVAVLGEASNLDSFSITMTAESQMESDGVNMDNITESAMDIVLKPEIAFKQLTSVEAEGQKQNIESYFTADGFFMKDPTSDSWVKLPNEFKELAFQSVDQQALDPSAQLAELLDYADQFHVIEKDGIYTFTLKAQGEAFSELIQEKLDEQESAWGQTIDMEIKALEYTVQVEKKSNNLLAMDIYMDMSMPESESTPAMSVKSKINMNYSNHNGIKEIVVPEAAANAEELDLGALSGLPQSQ